MSQNVPLRPSTLPRTRTTRSRQLSERLQQMALQGGAGARLPSMPELRRDLGVSMTTLSATVAELESQGVIERRRGVGLFVTQRASELVARTLVLVVSPRLMGAGHAPFWDVLVRIVEGRARQSGQKIEFHFALSDSSHTPAASGREWLHKGLAEAIESGAVAGVFLVDTPLEVSEWIEACGVPTVTYAGPGRCAVSHDRPEFLRRGIAALLAAGCHRIGVWGASQLWTGGAAMQSVDEFLADEWGAQLNGVQLLPTQSPSQTATLTAREAGWQLAHRVFASDNRADWPDGVLIDNDVLTRGALVALRKAGVSIGDDLVIVSHANRDTDVLADTEDELIRLEYDPAAIVAQMFAIMEKRWQAEPTAPQRVFMTPTLVQPSIGPLAIGPLANKQVISS